MCYKYACQKTFSCRFLRNWLAQISKSPYNVLMDHKIQILPLANPQSSNDQLYTATKNEKKLAQFSYLENHWGLPNPSYYYIS
jgi:hypothetical protein